MSSRAAQVVGPVALALLFAAGIVLAASWLIAFPESVLIAAWLVASAALVAVAVTTGIESRSQGYGPVRTIGRMISNLGRFILAFF